MYEKGKEYNCKFIIEERISNKTNNPYKVIIPVFGSYKPYSGLLMTSEMEYIVNEYIDKQGK